MSGTHEQVPVFWLKVFAFAFAAWSAMIPVGTWLVHNSMNTMAQAQKTGVERFEKHVDEQNAQTTRFNERLTTVETNQKEVLRRLENIEQFERHWLEHAKPHDPR